ncbi:unnamed protein product [Brassica oleracea]
MDLERALLLGSLFGIDAETLHCSSLSWWLVDVNESLAFRIDYHSKIRLMISPNRTRAASFHHTVFANKKHNILQIKRRRFTSNTELLHVTNTEMKLSRLGVMEEVYKPGPSECFH